MKDERAPSLSPLYPEDSAEILAALPDDRNAQTWAAYGLAIGFGKPPIGNVDGWGKYAKTVSAHVRAERRINWPDVNIAVERATLGKSRAELDAEEWAATQQRFSQMQSLGFDAETIRTLSKSQSQNSSSPGSEASEAGSE